jgi:hypothetical protein
MTTNIQNSLTTTKNELQNSLSSNRQTLLDKYTVLVEDQNSISSPKSNLLRKRVDFLKDKNTGKQLLTKKEKDSRKNTRHTFCGCSPQKDTVSIETNTKLNYKNLKQRNNFITGTALCKEIWRCPTCSMKLLKGRASEILELTQAHQKEGYKLGFVTLTVRHYKNNTLKQSLDKLLTNYRKFQQHKYFRTLKKSTLLGQIKSLEITHTQKHGWHPHVHILYFYKTNNTQFIEKAQNELIQDWARYTNGYEKAQNQQVVYTDKDITDYITKWDAIQELTNDHNKKAKGIKPFQLLTLLTKGELLFDYKDPHKSKKVTTKLWLEYVESTKGKRRIITSRSLLQLYKLDQKTDEDILEEKEDAEKIISFSKKTWRFIYRHNLQPYLLYICDLYKSQSTQQQEIFKFLTELDDFYLDTREWDVLKLTDEPIIRTLSEKELIPEPDLFSLN